MSKLLKKLQHKQFVFFYPYGLKPQTTTQSNIIKNVTSGLTWPDYIEIAHNNAIDFLEIFNLRQITFCKKISDQSGIDIPPSIIDTDRKDENTLRVFAFNIAAADIINAAGETTVQKKQLRHELQSLKPKNP